MTPYLRPLIALGFVAYGLFLRIKCLAGRELWGDELFQLRYTIEPFLPIWQRVLTGEVTCFPGDYVLTYPFVHMFPTNKWGLAIPHMMATVLGYYFLYLICQRYIKTIAGLVIIFFVVTFNQYLIYHALEFRPYPVLPTLSLGCFYFAGLIVNDYEKLKIWQKILIGAFFVFTVFFHAYGILILSSCLAFFILARFNDVSPWETLGQIKYFLLPVTLIAAPIFLWYASGNTGFTYQQNAIDRGMTTFDYIINPIENFDKFWRSMCNSLLGYKQYGAKWLSFGIGLALLLPHKDRLRQFGFLLILVILPITLVLFADLEKGYWFIQRQFIWVMPLYAFLIGWSWDSVIRKLVLREKN